mgnify:CR=1 FL=1
MICTNCSFYHPLSAQQPIAPMCAWKPAPEVWEYLRLNLPATLASRIGIKHAPYHVEACATFQEIRP